MKQKVYVSGFELKNLQTFRFLIELFSSDRFMNSTFHNVLDLKLKFFRLVRF